MVITYGLSEITSFRGIFRSHKDRGGRLNSLKALLLLAYSHHGGSQCRHTVAGQMLVIAMFSLPSRSKSIANPLVSTLIPAFPIA